MIFEGLLKAVSITVLNKKKIKDISNIYPTRKRLQPDKMGILGIRRVVCQFYEFRINMR
jgi:hypothetical protein